MKHFDSAATLGVGHLPAACSTKTVVEREDWDRRYEGSELVWTATPNRFLVAETEGLQPGAALDVGCGEGRNAVWLAEQGWGVTGVDFSELGLDKAHRLAEARGGGPTGGLVLPRWHDRATAR